MRFASLGSGSRGNALVVEAGTTRILIDCGFGPRELTRRLARLGLAADAFAAIVVTHEHGDHGSGVAANANRHGLDVFLTHGTFAALRRDGGSLVSPRLIDSHASFAIGDLIVQPFPVPHDAREPVQYILSDGASRLGVLTDVGCVTPHIVELLSCCDALVLECNHDLEMLAAGKYPEHLKRRISGRDGHLDNGAAAALLAQLDTARLQHIVAAHLSQQNNRSELAQQALAGALGCTCDWIEVASQEEGFSWRELA
jgi:phosphoribosyl 1,2-cyclic phosphodiesterase